MLTRKIIDHFEYINSSNISDKFIVIDTETTGLNPIFDKMIEISCIEIDFNLNNYNEIFSTYINPGINIGLESQNIHGITNDFILKYPYFIDIASSLKKIIEDSNIIMHNAPFDIGFINLEFKKINRSFIIKEERVFDTLKISKEIYGKRLSLDVLANKFDISKNLIDERKIKHGAVIDAKILSEVCLKIGIDKFRSYHTKRKLVY